MHDEPSKQAPFTLIELLVVITLLLLFTELFMGFPSSLARAHMARQVKKSYLADYSSQGLAVPVNPDVVKVRWSGCIYPCPTSVRVKTVSGETYNYRFTGAHWWTTKWDFKLSYIMPAYTNMPTAAIPPLPSPSVTITNTTAAVSAPLNNLVPLNIPEL